MLPDTAFLVYYTKSTELIKAFWDSLKVEANQYTDDKVVVVMGNIEIHYILDTTEPFEEYLFATMPTNRGQGIIHYFSVNDIEKFRTAVEKLKPAQLTEIKNNHWDAKEFLFSDPDGYLFAVYEMVF